MMMDFEWREIACVADVSKSLFDVTSGLDGFVSGALDTSKEGASAFSVTSATSPATFVLVFYVVDSWTRKGAAVARCRCCR